MNIPYVFGDVHMLYKSAPHFLYRDVSDGYDIL